MEVRWRDRYVSGMGTGLAATIILALILAAIAVIDWRQHIIPDYWNAVLAASGLLVATLDPAHGFLRALIGMAVALGAGLIARQAYAWFRARQGLGLGDVKFLAASGAWVGGAGLPFLILFASISGLAFAIALHVSGRPVTAASRIAFGPHLALGLLLTWVLNPDGMM